VGSIDQTLAELTCVSCEAAERVSVHQTVNVWPKLDNAKCLSCGSSNVQVTYPNPELIH